MDIIESLNQAGVKLAESIVIHPHLLSTEAIENILIAFVCADSNCQQDKDSSLSHKIMEIKNKLNKGASMLVYDHKKDNIQIISSDQGGSLKKLGFDQRII